MFLRYTESGPRVVDRRRASGRESGSARLGDFYLRSSAARIAGWTAAQVGFRGPQRTANARQNVLAVHKNSKFAVIALKHAIADATCSPKVVSRAWRHVHISGIPAMMDRRPGQEGG
jgi:hypothetical protein